MTTSPPATPPEKTHVVWLVPAVVDGLVAIHGITSDEALAAARLAQVFHTELEELLSRRLGVARVMGLEARETAAQAFVCAAWAKAIEMGARPQLFTQTMMVLEGAMPRPPGLGTEEPTPRPTTPVPVAAEGPYCWCLKCGKQDGTWLIRDEKMVCRETPDGNPCGGDVKTRDDETPRPRNLSPAELIARNNAAIGDLGEPKE